MPRDYKSYSSSKTSRSGQRKGGNNRIILWAVVIAVVIIATFVFYWVGKQNKHFSGLNLSKTSPVNKPTTAAQPAKPAVPAQPQVKFEFYNILPKEQVNEPNDTSAASTQPSAPTQMAPVSNYIVQVTSVKNATDADAIKAKLALSGFTAQVVQTKSSNGTAWYRVQIGPYTNFDDAYDAQNSLRKKNFDGLIRRSK